VNKPKILPSVDTPTRRPFRQDHFRYTADRLTVLADSLQEELCAAIDIANYFDKPETVQALSPLRAAVAEIQRALMCQKTRPDVRAIRSRLQLHLDTYLTLAATFLAATQKDE